MGPGPSDYQLHTLLLKAHPINGQVIIPPAKFVCCMISIKSILKLISTSKMQKLAADVVHTGQQ
jgi:hypothetical protein